MGLGPIELIAILAIALLIFGPKKLPEIGRTIGSAVREFKSGLDQIQQDIGVSDIKDALETDVKDIQEEMGDVQKDVDETLSFEKDSANMHGPFSGTGLRNVEANSSAEKTAQGPSEQAAPSSSKSAVGGSAKSTSKAAAKSTSKPAAKAAAKAAAKSTTKPTSKVTKQAGKKTTGRAPKSK